MIFSSKAVTALRLAVVLAIPALLLAGTGHAAASGAGLPVAAFSVSPAEGSEPVTAVFTDLSTSDDGIVSWLWDFGDGETSSEQSPAHVYAQDGVYTVILTVSEGDGDTDTDIQADCVVVVDTGPQAGFHAAPQSGLQPLTVEFTDSTVSYDPIASWLWDFGDGQTSSEQHPVYQYVDEGTYTVSLTVVDADGDTDSDARTEYITVQSLPQAAFCASSTSLQLGDEVNFEDLSTGEIVSWLWDFDNDDVVDSTERDPAHLYDAAGTYTVSLTVIGADGSDVETKADYITVSGIGAAGANPVSIVPTRVAVGAGSPSNVQTEDGAVSLGFTEGALAEDGTVTIRGQLAVDSSACPASYTPGATCFSVESTAALVPSAAMTITVLVSDGDVEACGGDLNRLRLAWFDPLSGEWEILPTSVDPEAGALSVTADQFGTWMVLVAEGAGFPVGATVGGVVGGLGLVAAGFVMIRSRRQPRA